MADYSQFPYGMPFPPLPHQYAQHLQHPQPSQQPQLPQSAPVTPQGGLPDPNFQFNTGYPGLNNLQSYGQNMQQPQYPSWPAPPAPPQHAYAPGLPPPPFLSQNGLAFPPPPPPGAGFFPPGLSAQRPPVSSPAYAPPTSSAASPQQMGASTSNRVVEMMDSDREDGELSETGGASNSPAGRGRAPVEAPRSMPVASNGSAGNESRSGRRKEMGASRGQCAGGSSAMPAMNSRLSSGQQTPTGPSTLANIQQKREEAKTFVTLLAENNIPYSVLAKEDLDPQLLRGLFKDMNLAVPPEATAAPVPLPKMSASSTTGEMRGGGTTSTTKTVMHSAATKLPPMIRTNVAPVPPAKSDNSPKTRNEYVARLQAAKMAKQLTAAKATSPQRSPLSKESAPSVPPTTTKAPQPAIAETTTETPLTKAPISEEEKARKTALIKERLKLLKASGKLPSSNPSTSRASGTAGSVSSEKPALPALMRQGSDNPAVNHGAPFSKIPGLFMNSFPAKTPPIPTQNGTAITGHKRPVASDFDDDMTPRTSGPAYTRPLGQSPHEHDAESMIIEVSDDNSSGSEMDIDEEQAGPQPTRNLPSASTQRDVKAVGNFSPSSSFPSRPGSIRPTSSAMNASPVSRTPDPQKQKELNRKIAELRARIDQKNLEQKRLNEAKQVTTYSSPAPQKLEQAPGNKQAHIPSQVPGGVTPVTLLDEAPDRTVHSVPQVEKHSTISGKASGSVSTEWKQQRRAQIESALKSLDTGLDDDNARLAQLEKERAEINAKREKNRRDRERLVQELESYGIDTEGMGNVELQAHMDEIDLQKGIESGIQSEQVGAPGFKTIDTSQTVVNASDIRKDAPQPVIASFQEPISTTSAAETKSAQPPATLSVITPLQVSKEPIVGHVQEREPTPVSFASADHPQLPEQLAFPLGGETPTVSATPVDDEEDFYSPAPATPPGAAKREASEEGEVEMSESASEDEEEYEPEEPEIVAASLSVPSTQEMEIARSPSSSASATSMSTAEDEGEIYEPPEDQNLPDLPTASDSSVQLVGADDQGEMDISTLSSDEAESPLSSCQDSEQEQHHSSISGNHHAGSVVVIADDLAPELQPQVSSGPENVVLPATEAEVPIDTRFVPYESPLRMFRSYRWHPSYSQDVAGGFLSLTYSHQIDPQTPLCRFESVGGTCNDPQCEGQHFRDMNITGDKLLLELGTANPGNTSEEKQKWNDGLRIVLKELRQNKISDPDGIAMEISKYRRQYFNDDTRVVTTGDRCKD